MRSLARSVTFCGRWRPERRWCRSGADNHRRGRTPTGARSSRAVAVGVHCEDGRIVVNMDQQSPALSICRSLRPMVDNPRRMPNGRAGPQAL